MKISYPRCNRIIRTNKGTQNKHFRFWEPTYSIIDSHCCFRKWNKLDMPHLCKWVSSILFSLQLQFSSELHDLTRRNSTLLNLYFKPTQSAKSVKERQIWTKPPSSSKNYTRNADKFRTNFVIPFRILKRSSFYFAIKALWFEKGAWYPFSWDNKSTKVSRWYIIFHQFHWPLLQTHFVYFIK